MKKEIGSIFPLSDEVIQAAESKQSAFTGDRLFYSLCREALYDIAISLAETNKKVLIPAYTCQTVITPFEEAGWQCCFYSIKYNLRIDKQSLTEAISQHQPSLLVVHPFFGMDLDEEEVNMLNAMKKKDLKIIIDLTQCLFSTKPYSFASFVVASYRKWMPIPDGSYLLPLTDFVHVTQPEAENEEFTQKEMDAMYLRSQYFDNGDQRIKAISIRLSKEADSIAENNIKPHKMSQVAYNLYKEENLENNQKCRFENYSYLFHNICESSKITKVCNNEVEVTTAPLYFTIYVQDRLALQSLFAQDSIYAPVIWPVEDERVLISDEVIYIYEHILAIPCDQRYNTDDMQRVVAIINNY